MASIIRTNGMRTIIHPRNGTDFSLEELKIAIGGGHIEIVPVDNTHVMVCDEDGRGKELEPNLTATVMVTILGAKDNPDVIDLPNGFKAAQIDMDHVIVGQVLFCKKDEIK
jgi:Domain of unknown function (DUF3846)